MAKLTILCACGAAYKMPTQAIMAAQPYELPRHKPTLEAERILTVDLAITQAQAKGVTPTISREGGQHPAFTKASRNMVTMATLLDTLPPPSTDWVDRLYR
jgi:hypothetical protein